MSFWNGMFEPGDDEFEQAKGVLSNKSFPMKFKSEDMLGLYPIIGTLEGIYYLDGDDNIACKVIS
jgi:hypothetical protein